MHAQSFRFAPMLLSSAREPFDSPRWQFEPKWDGFRILAQANGVVELLSRTRYPFTTLFWPIARDLRSIESGTVLDGEVTMLDREGRPDFDLLQDLLRWKRGESVEGVLVYIVFDCLCLTGRSLLNEPLERRQEVAQEVVSQVCSDRIRMVGVFPGTEGRLLYSQVASFGLEGVVAKKRGSTYQPGARSSDWLKIPLRQRATFIVCGHVPNASDQSKPGGLILAESNGQGFRFVGTARVLSSNPDFGKLISKLSRLALRRCPLPEVPLLRDHFGDFGRPLKPQWIKPDLLADVEFRQRSSKGLRHATFKMIVD